MLESYLLTGWIDMFSEARKPDVKQESSWGHDLADEEAGDRVRWANNQSAKED